MLTEMYLYRACSDHGTEDIWKRPDRYRSGSGQSLTLKVDVYSFGMVLYEMVAPTDLVRA